MAMIHVGLAALIEVDSGGLDPAEAETLVIELACVGDRVGGELARFAAVVAASESGASSMPAWLSSQTGMGLGRARCAVELGAAMGAVPALDAAVRGGELSPAAAATVIPALADVGFADAAGPLIDELNGKTPAQAGRQVDDWHAIANPADDTERRQTARDGRTVSFRPIGDGTTHIEGVVPDETAQTLRQALAHLADQQRLDGSAGPATSVEPTPSETSPPPTAAVR